MPVGAPTHRRSGAHGLGDLPRAEEAAATTPATTPMSATRAASRPTSPRPTTALGFIMQAHRGGGLQARRGRRCWRSTAASTEFYQGRQIRDGGRGQDPRCRRHGRLPRRSRRALSDRLDRGRHGRGRLGRLEAADRASSAARCSSSATISSSPTRSGCADGIARGSPTAILVKVNQIGTLSRDAGRGRAGASRRLQRGDVATAPARPRTRPSPISPSPPIAARSRPARCRAPTGSPNTTSSSASRSSWARGALCRPLDTAPLSGGEAGQH